MLEDLRMMYGKVLYYKDFATYLEKFLDRK